MYEPKIEVVQQDGMGGWNTLCAKHPSIERAYLVRSLPMPGEKVHNGFSAHTVAGLEIHDGEICVRYDHGGFDPMEVVRPYDPEAERLRAATVAVIKVPGTPSWAAPQIARAVLDALKEVDDG